jgi:phage gpG-like protein
VPVRITVSMPTAEMKKMASGIAERARKIKPALLEGRARDLRAVIDRRFATRGGGSWGEADLEDTGFLRRTISTRAKKASVVFAPTAHYGRFHQRGEGVPRRAFLPISEDGRTDASEVGREWWDETRERVVDYLMHGETR